MTNNTITEDFKDKIEKEMKVMQEENISNDLAGYTGTEHYYKIPFSKVVYTDGIKGLIEKCKCWWLINDLGIEYSAKEELKRDFLVVTLKVNEDKSAILTLKEDTNEKPIFTKEYDWTDFPLKEFEFYLINNIFLLKNEY